MHQKGILVQFFETKPCMVKTLPQMDVFILFALTYQLYG